MGWLDDDDGDDDIRLSDDMTGHSHASLESRRWQAGGQGRGFTLMLQNFSNPISAPKPASVKTYPSGPTSLRATWRQDVV